MNRLRALRQAEDAARISDAARLANEIQREFPEASRTAALREAERLQAKHGMGLTLDTPVSPGRPPTTGRYDTRAELEQHVRMWSATMSDAQVARVCRVSEGVVRSILARPAA